jgi:hypothetical protein
MRSDDDRRTSDRERAVLRSGEERGGAMSMVAPPALLYIVGWDECMGMCVCVCVCVCSCVCVTMLLFDSVAVTLQAMVVVVF